METNKLITGEPEWLSVKIATKHFGYSHPENLRQRLRQLRKRGEIVDLGNPPNGYIVSESIVPEKVVILWPHPLTALIHKSAPPDLLNPKRGKRAKVKEGERE